MANTIKTSGEGVALQVTREVRSAGLVDETPEGDAIRRAPVRVFAFDDLLLVFDLENVETTAIVDLVTSAARDTASIYRAMDATVKHGGDGYQIQLPCAADAGFRTGDLAPCTSAPNMLIITKHGSKDASRLKKDLLVLRDEQGR